VEHQEEVWNLPVARRLNGTEGDFYIWDCESDSTPSGEARILASQQGRLRGRSACVSLKLAIPFIQKVIVNDLLMARRKPSSIGANCRFAVAEREHVRVPSSPDQLRVVRGVRQSAQSPDQRADGTGCSILAQKGGRITVRGSLCFLASSRGESSREQLTSGTSSQPCVKTNAYRVARLPGRS
jgi:hypothetical protein